MATFGSIDLSAIATVDLGGTYRKPDLRRQLSQQTAPGVDGGFILIGGVMPQQFGLPIRLRGTGTNNTEALAALQNNDITLSAAIGSTETFTDDNGVLFGGCTLIGVRRVTGTRYHNEGATYVCSMDLILQFYRALTS